MAQQSGRTDRDLSIISRSLQYVWVYIHFIPRTEADHFLVYHFLGIRVIGNNQCFSVSGFADCTNALQVLQNQYTSLVPRSCVSYTHAHNCLIYLFSSQEN
jgi:hypothetical protein